MSASCRIWMTARFSFPQDLGEAAAAQLDAALCAALAAAGHLAATCPAHRLPVLYAGMLLLEISPRGVPCFDRSCEPSWAQSKSCQRASARTYDDAFSILKMPIIC